MVDSNNLVSIVIPAFRAEHSIYRLVKEILKVFSNFKIEIIVVNDCSPDKTHEECLKLIKEYSKELTYIKLSKNVGEHNAVMAGLKHSNGEWMIRKITVIRIQTIMKVIRILLVMKKK